MTGHGPRVTRLSSEVDGQVRLQLIGEIDMQVADLVASWLRESLDAHPGRDLVVDLAGLSFLDSSGIRCLVDAHREHADRGLRMTVAGAHGVVLTVLQVTGVYHTLCHSELPH